MHLLCRIVTPHPDIVVVRNANKSIYKTNNDRRDEEETYSTLSIKPLLGPAVFDCQEVVEGKRYIEEACNSSNLNEEALCCAGFLVALGSEQLV